jgi:CRP-like cAMP-binding protein
MRGKVSMDIRASILDVEAFRHLDDDSIDQLVSSSTVREASARSVIVPQGVQGEAVWVLIEGLVEVFKDRGRGRKESIAILGKGDIFGEISVISGMPTTAEIVAKEDCVAVNIPGDLLTRLIKSNIVMAAIFSSIFVKRLSS